MRRLLSEAVRYLKDLGRSGLHGWQRFFFTPCDPTPLGLIRLVCGALLFWCLAVLGFDLNDYLGSEGWIGPEAAQQYLVEHSPWGWSFWVWIPDRWLGAAWAVCLIVAGLFAAGYRSRVTAVLAWIIAVSTVRRAPVTLFGFDLMLSTWLFYLAALGASGQALSLDRWSSRLRRTKTLAPPSLKLGMTGQQPPSPPLATVSANLSLRLIQLHLVLIYGCAGLSKLMGPEWWNGTALEMLILTPEFRRFNMTWLLAYPAILSLGTHLGVLLEISYPVLVWIPKLRPLLLACVIAMHLSIDLILGLTEFGLAMIAANLAFFSGTWLRRVIAPTKTPRPVGSAHRRKCLGERAKCLADEQAAKALSR